MANTVAANSISWFADNAHNETVLYVNTTAAANHVDMEIHLTGTNINLTGFGYPSPRLIRNPPWLRFSARHGAVGVLTCGPVRRAATNSGIRGIIQS